MGDKRVVVHKNEANAAGKLLILNSNMDIKRFLKAAGKKLGLKKTPRKVFLATGVRVEDVDEMQNNDLLYISHGEPFYKNADRDKREEKVTVSVLGTGGVGKSALTLRFIRDCFVEEWDPTIEDAYRKTVDVDDKLSTIEILDTAGQDDFLSLRPQWMIEKDGYIFVYSMTSPHSLDELQHFYELHQQINEHRTVPIVLVANKRDLVRESSDAKVTTEMGEAMAKEWGATYIETSAFSGLNVDKTFHTFIRKVREGRSPRPPPPSGFCCLL